MNLYRDNQIKGYCFFLLFYGLLLFGTNLALSISQTANARALYYMHDEAIASSLLEQGIPRDIVVIAFTNTETSAVGQKLLDAAGVGRQSENYLLPFFRRFQQITFYTMFTTALFLCLILFAGSLIFFMKRKQLYTKAEKVVDGYINGDYSGHLPQNHEGAIFQVFASVERLATMLQSKNETEYRTKEFLKHTISDISHQLKTPLAALTMYQEIIANEPENPDTIKRFSAKMDVSLRRMENLIQAMLKITRLDAGNILFCKDRCPVTELISYSISELEARAEKERKKIFTEGNSGQTIICDFGWTAEAVGNIVKNALDHMEAGGIVHISWEYTPIMLRISIADNGSGIAPEDISHVFKRFFRGKDSIGTQGIGLGLSLAKAIIEGQGGLISLQSEQGAGTVFIISFSTEL